MDRETQFENEFIIGTMTWSFSRLNSYYNCPWEWYQHYYQCNKGAESAFGQFGSFCHSCLESYAKGELNLFNIPQYYEENYEEEVTLPFPNNKYVDLNEKYYEAGLEYFNNIDLDIETREILGVEKKVEFEIEGYPFVGFIDLLVKDKETGEIGIVDHKSASIKVLKNGNISKSDQAHFQEFKRQLYLYSKPVIEEYGKVDYLEWNMFKDRRTIRIPWKQEEYEEAIQWALDTIHTIEKEEMWLPNPDWYYCHNLCSMRMNACDYKP